MNDVDEPRADGFSSKRPAGSPVGLFAASTRITAPVLLGLACLVLGTRAIWAETPVGRVTGLVQTAAAHDPSSAEGGSIPSLMRVQLWP